LIELHPIHQRSGTAQSSISNLPNWRTTGADWRCDSALKDSLTAKKRKVAKNVRLFSSEKKERNENPLKGGFVAFRFSLSQAGKEGGRGGPAWKIPHADRRAGKLRLRRKIGSDGDPIDGLWLLSCGYEDYQLCYIIQQYQ
jgi:hypothetical protein